MTGSFTAACTLYNAFKLSKTDSRHSFFPPKLSCSKTALLYMRPRVFLLTLKTGQIFLSGKPHSAKTAKKEKLIAAVKSFLRSTKVVLLQRGKNKAERPSNVLTSCCSRVGEDDNFCSNGEIFLKKEGKVSTLYLYQS